MRYTWKQFIKFGIVGASSAAINLGLYYFFIWIGSSYILANIMGWLCSVCNTFIWNHCIVFSNKKSWIINLIKTYITYAASLVLTTFFLWILVDQLQVSKIIAPIFVMGGMTPINFLINKYWVYRCEV